MNKILAFAIANHIDEDLQSFITSVNGTLYGITDFEEGEWTLKYDYDYKEDFYGEIHFTNVQKGRLCSYTNKHRVKEKFNFILECTMSKYSSFCEDDVYKCDNYKVYEG